MKVSKAENQFAKITMLTLLFIVSLTIMFWCGYCAAVTWSFSVPLIS